MPNTQPPWLGVIAAVGAVALTTLVVYPLKRIAADISLSVVYLLGVLHSSPSSCFSAGEVIGASIRAQ